MEKILIWNINQRAGYGKSFYPKLVLDSFDKELDIIIFTEFYKHSDWKNTFSNDKYLFETSNNGDNHNEILIAYNREKYSKIGDKYTWKSDYDKDSPDYLDICLKDNLEIFSWWLELEYLLITMIITMLIVLIKRWKQEQDKEKNQK